MNIRCFDFSLAIVFTAISTASMLGASAGAAAADEAQDASSQPTVAAPAAPASNNILPNDASDVIYAGDTVTVVKNNVELGLRDKPAAIMNANDALRVTEVRGAWIGGYMIRDGQRYTGWVNRDDVRLVVIPADQARRIEVPDVADDPQAVAALREAKVKLDANLKGNIYAADGAESTIEDRDMAHFQKLRQLATLDLSGRPITDAGLKSLDKSTAITELYLDKTKITDEGLALLDRFPNLEVLALSETAITDAGLAHVKGLKHLRVLNLSKTEVTDAGLAHLEKMVTLGVLALNGTEVTSAGLAHLRSLPDLRVLNLIDCPVDDDGLEHLSGLEELRMLYVGGTKVTAQAREKLKTACPSLAIFED